MQHRARHGEGRGGAGWRPGQRQLQGQGASLSRSRSPSSPGFARPHARNARTRSSAVAAAVAGALPAERAPAPRGPAPPRPQRDVTRGGRFQIAERPAAGMAVLRPFDKLPELNSATILVGLRLPGSPPSFSPSPFPARFGSARPGPAGSAPRRTSPQSQRLRRPHPPPPGRRMQRPPYADKAPPISRRDRASICKLDGPPLFRDRPSGCCMQIRLTHCDRCLSPRSWWARRAARSSSSPRPCCARRRTSTSTCE